MVFSIADSIVSPLGMTTAENYQAVKAGRSALQRYDHWWGLPDPFTASLFTDEQNRQLKVDGLTRFESLVVRSVQTALKQVALDMASERMVFVLSTTKANIELLSDGVDVGPAEAAQHVADYLGMTTQPIVVCNACISGVAAIVLAQRLLEAEQYDTVVVCGADVQNAFTVSGFQSLKAVAEEACRPFDLERLGLNLGEAAATMVFQREHTDGCWAVANGALRNDGYHISAPSKNGEGARQVLETVGAVRCVDQLAFINAHGTATMFNDQMESVAIERAGLQTVPVNGYKGYFGHTLGAAGVLETVLSMAAADDNTILGTRGFEYRGVSGKIQLSAANAKTDKRSFVKMISGFGGCNGALLMSKNPIYEERHTTNERQVTHQVTLTPTMATVDGKPVAVEPSGRGLLTDLYKQHIDDYPKYYKMDGLSRLGFVASELLLKAEGCEATERREDRAVILFNHSSSIAADRKYQESIADNGDFFPSPSVFVYTLPNIVTGEIAIRHQYGGETSFYILPERNEQLMRHIVCASFADSATRSMLTGWIDFVDDSHFEAELLIVEKLL